MEIRVLGTVDVTVDGQPVVLGGAKQRTLLALLLAARGGVVSLDRLAEALWGDDPPATARPTLQTSLSKLRRAVGGADVRLESRAPGYRLVVADGVVDAARFEAELAQARRLIDDRADDAIALLDRALARWQGPAFAGFTASPSVLAEAVRLDELRLQAVEDRNRARLARGDLAAVIGELEGLTVVTPLRERLRLQLMEALARSGRQAEASRVAAGFRRHLREELGLDPSAAFDELERAVLDGTVPDPAGRRAPGTSPGATAVVRTPPERVLGGGLVGRVEALDDAAGALARARLVTLTGPGGVGKSAMAQELARRLTRSYADGMRWVELAPVADPDGVAGAIAQVVGTERRSARSLTDAVVEVLASKDLLVVLDNCEHVVEAVGEIVERVVRWCPGVTVLATSREPIGLPGEVVRPVAPLAVPEQGAVSAADIVDNPAVEVFVRRAGEASPAFALTDANAPAVAQLCVQLDGLPLALELAAARMSSMTPRQLADRLQERFTLLGAGQGRSRRHRTLLDVVQWSYGLLDPHEQALLARLSVFAGGFDLEAAERTCAGGPVEAAKVASLLAGLVDKSLVVATPSGDSARYVQLETLRQFGAARLADQPGGPEVRLAHLATYVARAATTADGIEGPDEAAWAARDRADVDNLRAAWSTAVAVGDVDAALQLVVAASEPGFRAIRYQVCDWAEAVVERPDAQQHPLLPSAIAVVGLGAFVRGELDRAVALARRAIDRRERLGVASCGLPERVLGNALFYQGHRDEALDWIARMVEVARDAGRHGRHAHALYMWSVANTSTGDAVAGRALADESAAVAGRTGSPTALAQARFAQGLAVAADDPERALLLLDEAASLADGVGNRWMQAFAATEAMWLRALRGDLDAALDGYREVIDTWFRGGDWANQWLSLRRVAGILASQGMDDEAALLSGALSAAGASSALPIAPNDVDELDELALALERRLGVATFAQLHERGSRLAADAAVALARRAIDVLRRERG